uniref:Hypothetical secreted peptide 1406 n=1 Tax=Amblyomma variegatum TaxID=34610 RepID=F0J9V5_AMBVA|nr:TPA_inf: hypothetical secreted peptide precursor 1406 [Amblyomma variegatum]
MVLGQIMLTTSLVRCVMTTAHTDSAEASTWPFRCYTQVSAKRKLTLHILILHHASIISLCFTHYARRVRHYICMLTFVITAMHI